MNALFKYVDLVLIIKWGYILLIIGILALDGYQGNYLLHSHK
jgi:hypothetical protein